jgi:serine/threonine protein kinase
MKEKLIQEDTNGGIKRDKIFEVLNKKRKPDNPMPQNYKAQKKIKFIINRINPIPNRNNLPVNKNNENIINYNYNLYTNNQTHNFNNKTFNNIIKPNIINNNINNINQLNNNNNALAKYTTLAEQQTTVETNSNKTESQIQEYGDYICNNENPIGSGSFGQVLYGKHKNTSLEVAVKVISSDTSTDTIRKEINFSKQLQKITGFPTIYYTCVYDKKNIIVESLLGPSLDKLFKYCGRKFPLKTVCLIGKEIVKRLENMHEKGILHRDLKPNNLTWGNFNSSYNNISNYNSINNISNNLDIKTIFLIDFGLSCSFLEGGLSYKHYKIKTNLSFVGTLRYASLNSHKGIRQSRRDDLESMIYILIYFLKGKLPWQDVKAKQKEERHKLISEIKSKVTIESLCENLPSEFAELLTYVKNLEFDEKPIYSKFYAFFHNLIEKLNKEMIEEKDYSYIWETLLVDNMMRYNEYNDENLKEEAEKLIFKGYPINLKNFTNYIIYNNRYKK